MKYWQIFFIIIISMIFHGPVLGEGEQNQPSDEFIKYKELAEKGDANAQFKLAEYYYLGSLYVPRDRRKAADLYEMAALQGHIEAQAELAFCYSSGSGRFKNPQKAVFWWEKAAIRGDPDSQYWLGKAYYDGEGVPRSYSDALKWVTRAAENGVAFARGLLGNMYLEGRGVAKDNIRAYAWLNIVSDWRMYKEQRDELEGKMSPKDVIAAQNLSKLLLIKYGKTRE